MLIRLSFGMLIAALTTPAASAQTVKVTPVEIVEIRCQRLEQRDGNDVRPQQEPRLVLKLRLQGRPAADARFYGHASLVKAVDDQGQPLTPAVGPWNNPYKGYIEIDRDQMFIFEEEKPTDELIVALGFNPPGRAAQTISVSGQLDLRSLDVRRISVGRLREIESFDHALLKEKGIELSVTKLDRENGSVTVVYRGKEGAIADIQLADKEGKPLTGMGLSRMTNRINNETQETLSVDGTLDPEATLLIDVVQQERIAPVKFELTDLKLP